MTDYSWAAVHTKKYFKLIANNWQSCIIGEMYIIKRRKKKNVQYHEKKTKKRINELHYWKQQTKQI